MVGCIFGGLLAGRDGEEVMVAIRDRAVTDPAPILKNTAFVAVLAIVALGCAEVAMKYRKTPDRGRRFCSALGDLDDRRPQGWQMIHSVAKQLGVSSGEARGESGLQSRTCVRPVRRRPSKNQCQPPKSNSGGPAAMPSITVAFSEGRSPP